MNALKKYKNSLINLIYPATCSVCGEMLQTSENEICLSCRYFIPKTNFHKQKDNPIEQIFWGRTNIEKATSYFRYTKGSRYSRLIHLLKYQGRYEIGEELGYSFAKELKKDSFLDDIDLLIPVPLHKKKFKIRGYNQSEQIAIGMAKSSGIEIDCNSLKRNVFTKTQTKKSRTDRWDNVENVFELISTENVQNKHILLIDDVVTTGATLEACCNAITEKTNAKISIASLCHASTI